MTSLRPLLALGLLLSAGASGALEIPLAHYGTVRIAPARTSIYVGVVDLATGPMARERGVYASDYSAKVFPYFFWNEQGKLYIPVSDDGLRRLEKGQALDFSGRAVRSDGTTRNVVGRATPTDANGGTITVRIFVTQHIVLSFHTTYRFAGPP